MHFDDRLGTVLRFRADSAARKRVQYRQLLDLLGTLPNEARSEQIDAAHVRLAELRSEIPEIERADMLKDPALRLRSTRLVSELAGHEPRVAAAALVRAELAAEAWLDLIPALPVPARGFLRLRRDLGGDVEAVLERLGVHDRGLPAAEVEVRPSAVVEPLELHRPAPAPAPAAAQRGDGIGAIVRRIEAFRRSRQEADADAPRLPLGEDTFTVGQSRLHAFDFATDASGRIVWADPGAAPMAIGLPLGAEADIGPVELGPGIVSAVRRSQPLRGARLRIDGAPAISGEWQCDAAPWFDPLSGAFRGYRGRMRRPAAEVAVPIQSDSQSDRIRQLLHELRTPVNAIQGFAEVIQQQLFGPTPHEYRALAANVAGDAARMLAAFEELERLAKLDSGALEIERGQADLAAVAEATVGQLRLHTEPRSSGFAVRRDEGALPVGIAPLEAERIVWRLLATLAGTSAPGEQLKLRLRSRDGEARLTVALPASLAAKSDAELFNAASGAVPQTIAAGVFGVGFALRLAAAEARTAGGRLERRDGKLRLSLPLVAAAGLTAPSAGHSESIGDRGISQS